MAAESTLRSWRGGALVALVAAVLAVSCHGERAAVPPPQPHVSPISSIAAVDAEAPKPVTFMVPPLHVVLDDPRLVKVREREHAKDYAAAARAFDEVRITIAASAPDACAWDYESGRLHFLAGELPEAAIAFEAVNVAHDDGGAPSCALADYARLRAAQAYSRAGKPDDAIARAKEASDRVAADDEVKIVLAEALATKGDFTSAIPIWRTLLAANARGTRWVDTSVRLASALIDPKNGDPKANAKEAFDLATRVVVGAPRFSSSSGADAVRIRAHAALSGDARAPDPQLTSDEELARVQAWIDGSDATKALDELRVFAGTRSSPEQRCRAAILHAQALPRKKYDAWNDAISACAHHDDLATALYSGAKSSVQEKKYAEAIDRFEKVELKFPSHRFADDARYRAALLIEDSGDDSLSMAMLISLPDVYAQGDMKTEALFHLALMRVRRNEWDEAKKPLDRIVQIDPHDRHWATAGRAAYFRARASEMTGDAADAATRYEQIVSDAPLSFYMTRAYAKLAAIDAARAARVLDAAIAKDAEGAFPSSDHTEVHGAAFARARALLEVGEIDFAKREFAKASAGTTADAEGELAWIESLLYERAGVPEIACSHARKRSEYLAHYPSGRWRTIWEIAFPRAFEPLVVRESEARGIPAPLTWAIMREESGFLPEAKSGSNAFGLMQLIVPTAKWVGAGTGLATDEQALKTPEVSIALGAKLLANLRSTFATNPAFAIAAYNSGGGAVSHWIDTRTTDDFDVWVERIPYDETRGYVKRVVASEAAYAFLYARPQLREVLSLPFKVVP